MRLLDLEPRWFTHAGNERAGFVFRCPHCRDVWLSCTLVPIKMSEQIDIFDALLPDAMNAAKVVPCNQTTAWQASTLDFSTMSVKPSLNAEASGHWHGFITNGEVS